MIYIQTNAMSLPQKVLATFLGLAMLALGIMFSVVMIPVILVVGLIGAGYVYWKTRPLRKAMSQAAQENRIIEGEAIVITERQELRHHN